MSSQPPPPVDKGPSQLLPAGSPSDALSVHCLPLTHVLLLLLSAACLPACVQTCRRNISPGHVPEHAAGRERRGAEAR